LTSAALAPDFWAMSLSEISIEERSIISSLAATSNFSAVEFFALGSLFGTLVVTEIPDFGARAAADKPKQRLATRVN
jgi:hypothetical protein